VLSKKTILSQLRPKGHDADWKAVESYVSFLRRKVDRGEARPANLARFCFLDPQGCTLYPHWDEAANTTVAMLRTAAGRHPYDRDLSNIIGELSTRSETFRTRWANHNVRLHRTGSKLYRHPVVGRLTLEFEVMDLTADDGLALTAFTAADVASQDGLTLLASWAATLVHDHESCAGAPFSQENASEAT
jgi:hypothetical protein